MAKPLQLVPTNMSRGQIQYEPIMGNTYMDIQHRIG